MQLATPVATPEGAAAFPSILTARRLADVPRQTQCNPQCASIVFPKPSPLTDGSLDVSPRQAVCLRIDGPVCEDLYDALWPGEREPRGMFQSSS